MCCLHETGVLGVLFADNRLVSPHLEYGSCVWSTMYKMEKIKIENIQRRATKLLPELKHKSYTERLQSLELPSLEYRRLRADMIQTYKIFKNIDRIERKKIFKQYHTNVSTT